MLGKSILTSVIISILIAQNAAVAETAVDIQVFSHNGEHYKAVVSYEKLPKRVLTTEARIAYGRSCWALGLVAKAVEAFDQALQDENLSLTEKGRIYLSRGIIELQENNYQVAALFADKAAAAINVQGPLRAKTLLLSGQANARLGNYGVAEEKLKAALKDGSESDMSEILYQLGEAKLYLNQLDDARQTFESIPVEYDRTAYVIRRLSEIALAQGDAKRASFWLNKGRTEYSDSFLDSWVDYALIQAAISENDLDLIRKIKTQANGKFAPSDYWLGLLNASAEAYEWKRLASSQGAVNG